MSSLGSPNPFFIAGKKAYEVERSLRFNGADGPYLESQPSSHSNKKKNTFSFWFKRAVNTNFVSIFRAYGTSSNRQSLDFVSGGAIRLWGNYNGSVVMTLQTSRLFRDFSAWYHFVLVLDTEQGTASNRAKMYVNGVQITDFSNSSYPPQDFEFGFNDLNVNTQIGVPSDTQCNFYIAEFQAIDGLALDPSYFGETDPITGQWNPKKYVGSYGTNGFYLNFSDNSGTTATTLGKDSSGVGRNFTPYNFFVAAGAGNDSLEDSPTNNFCTFNPLKVNASNPIVFSEGNLQHNGISGDNHLRSATTMQVNSGKWYVEFKFVSGYEATNGTVRFGICTEAGHRDSNNDATWYQNTENFLAIQYGNNGTVYRSETGTNTSELTGLSTFVNGDVMGIALDLDNDKFFVSKNGTFFSNGTGTQDPAAGTNPLYSGGVLTTRKSDGFYFNIDGYSAQVVTADFGQQGYAYTPPTGFKKVKSANLPDPTILKPNQYFETLLYSGNDGSQSITGLNFQPDWVWIKRRNGTQSHQVYDAVRGAGQNIRTNNTNAEVDQSDKFTSFTSDGFTLNTSDALLNINGGNYVAWNWDAGDTDGKTYTVTVVDDSGNKYRFDGFGTSAVTLDLAEGGTYIFNYPSAHPLKFSTTADGTHGGGSEYTTGVTYNSSTQVTIVVAASAPTLYYYCGSHSGMGGQVNTNSTLGSSNFDGTIQSTVKASSTSGFSIVSFTGNATSGSTVGHGLGVAPKVLIVKERGNTNNWVVYHQSLGSTGGGNTYVLFLDLNYDKGGGFAGGFNNTSPTSSVFSLGNSNETNRSSGNFITYCFSEVAGYSKFGSYQANGNDNGSFVFTGFRPAWILIKNADLGQPWVLMDNKINPHNLADTRLSPSSSAAESTSADNYIDILSNGFKVRSPGSSDINYSTSYPTHIYLAFAESPFKYARAR